MKMIGDEVLTSAELMKEFFAMSERMINNISEKVRYEKICEYLVAAGAKKKENRFDKYATYEFLELDEELYLIPNQIFDELDEKWLQKLETIEESKVSQQKNSQVAS